MALSKHLERQSVIVNFCYFWLPPLILSTGILIMAGSLGSVAKFILPVSLLKFFLPSWSMPDIFQLYFMLRKAGHFFAYALLFAAYARAWRWHMHLSPWKAILLALAICLVISGADEGRQTFYNSRTGSLQDIALDMSGALLSAIALFPVLRQEA